MHKELNILLSAIKEAGNAILKLQQTNFFIEKKANNEMVTQADLLANDILKKHLLDSFPNYGWLSEETVDDLARLKSKKIWIVDPIDGTKEYAMKIPEYAISVALVEEGMPILSSVFNPAKDELFYAISGQGAFLNDVKIQCKPSVKDEMLLLSSRSEYNRGEWDAYARLHHVQTMGSIAYKLALVASGYAQATFSLGPKNEWDIAAGVLLMTEANGLVTDKKGKPFVFNREKVKVDGILASAQTNFNDIVQMVS